MRINERTNRQRVVKLLISFILQLLLTQTNPSEPQAVTKLFKVALNSERLPLLNLESICPEMPELSVLLDTGSQQLCIADHQCAGCLDTVSICSHVKNPVATISYLSNQVSGDYSYSNFCRNRFRFFCIISSTHSLEIEASGILGLKGNSSGFQFLQRIQEQSQLSSDQKQFAFYYGAYQSYFILGHIPSNMTRSVIAESLNSVENQIQLRYGQSEITFKTNQDWEIYFDSGSSVIVLPSQIFSVLAEAINATLKNQCKIEELILCNKWSAIYLSNISIEIDENTTLSIPPSAYVSSSKSSQEPFMIKVINQTQSSLQKVIILGEPIFSSYVVQFDLSRDTVSLYESNDETLAKLTLENIHFFSILYVLATILTSILAVKIHETILSKYEELKLTV